MKMRWFYNVRQKSKIIFWSTLILVLVFAKNWVEKNNVISLHGTFSSVYEDRLVAESYLFKLSHHLHQKNLIISTWSDSNPIQSVESSIDHHNKSIQGIVADYSNTKLTDMESSQFDLFQQNLLSLSQHEKKFISSIREGISTDADLLIDKMKQGFEATTSNLSQLSEIQITEGNLLKEESKRIVAGSTLLNQFELILIIALGITIQFLVLTFKSTLPGTPQKFQLN